MVTEFDELARKTFEIAHTGKHQDLLEKEKQESDFFDDVYEDVLEEGLPLAPAGPGLLFKIEKGSQTFCIRGFATDCIEQSLLDIESGEVSARAKIKFKSDDDYDHLNFFEIPSFELAFRIQNSLFNRRFPINESLVCNLSDPGFSWWLKDSEDGFELFFQTYQVLGNENFLSIGPIGDQFKAVERLHAAENILRKFFPIKEFSCDDKSFKIVPCDPENKKYQQFLDLLYRGENKFLSDFFPKNDDEQVLYNYLLELSCMRSLWINVEEILDDLME